MTWPNGTTDFPRKLTAEMRKNISDSAKRRYANGQGRERQRAVMSAKHTCPEPGCGYTTNVSNLTRHRRKEGH